MAIYLLIRSMRTQLPQMKGRETQALCPLPEIHAVSRHLQRSRHYINACLIGIPWAVFSPFHKPFFFVWEHKMFCEDSGPSCLIAHKQVIGCTQNKISVPSKNNF